MLAYMTKMIKQRNQIMKISWLRDAVKELGERFKNDELEYEILESMTAFLYTDWGFAGWWLRNRASWDLFLKAAERQAEAGMYSESTIERAFFDTLVNDVIDYLGCKNQDEFMEMKYKESKGIYT